MKILVNDHSGHAFTIQLSKALALLDNKVIHTYSANFQSPKGNFEKSEEDKNIEIIPIYYDNEFNKYSLLKRKKQEEEFANKLIKIIESEKPKVVINGNTPLFAQKLIQNYCIRQSIPFVYWCQDVYSIAMGKILEKKAGFLGRIVGAYLHHLEKRQLKKSSHIINITTDFNAIFLKWGVKKEAMSVIPNWAPINEISLIDKENRWSQSLGINLDFNIVYSGTLGLKHNPELLLLVAEFFRDYSGVNVVVISEGLGADFLKAKKEERKLTNLKILPFQNFKDMPAVLGASDILLAILEPAAGVFSVPSKVLTYLCAQKPIVLAVPQENLSSKIIVESGAGLSVNPLNPQEFVKAVHKIYEDVPGRMLMGLKARKYAEENFDIKLIAEKFQAIILNLK